MKRQNKTILSVAATVLFLMLMSCNRDNSMYLEFAGSITIEATIGQMSKATYNGNATTFTAADKILLYGWTGSKTEVPAKRVVDSVTCTFDGTVWTPAKPMRWRNVTDAHYFLGISPVPDSVTSFTAAAYKLDPANYTASDLLIATNLGGVKAADGPVILTFEHAMAKLNVNLKFRSEFDGTPVVSSVTAAACDSATVNYLTGQVTAAGSAGEVQIPQAAAPATGYEVSYGGLQVPQQGVKKITITIGSRKFVYESTQDIPLNAGHFTTVNLIAGRDRIELDEITISDWTADADLGCQEAVFDPYNGHEYVDLGLPSGLKWATCNVGASKPEEYGDYFAWGDTVPYYSSQDPLTWRENKTGYNWASYTWCKGSDHTLTKYCNKSGYGNDGFTDSKTTLDPEDDAASYQWGGSWRMPTKGEIEELIATRNNTGYTWTWCDGSTTKYAGTDVKGWQIVRISTGATLFLPAAGYRDATSLTNPGSNGNYWSSSLHDYLDRAWGIYFDSSGVSASFSRRFFGWSVRPVCP